MTMWTRTRALLGAALLACSIGVFAFAAPASANFGYFEIMNAGSHKCLAVPNNGYETYDPIIQTTCGAYGTKWRDQYYQGPTGSGSGWIRTVQNLDGDMLCMFATGLYNGAPVAQNYCGFGSGMFWDMGPDRYPQPTQFTVPIKQYGTNYCLDLENGQTQDGVPMQVWQCNPNTNNQKWVITLVSI